jgi:hypothetical protein
MVEADSDAISHHGYDPKTQTMALTFRGGKTYQYPRVPQAVYDDLTSAKSMGKHFARHISGKYKPA